jgi:hypothetical protein
VIAVGGELTADAPLSSGFHIAFTFDGEVCAVVTRASLPSGSRWTFRRPFFLLLTLPVGRAGRFRVRCPRGPR